MKLNFSLLALLAVVAVTVHAKPQSFFPDADADDGHDNLKMESVDAPTLAFPNDGDNDRDVPASPQAPGTHELDSESLRAIDTIVTATREGRRLQFNDSRLEELVSDPNVKEKLASASEVEARGFIRDKLCSIGLCDEGGFGHHGHGHHGGLSAAAKHVQLVQPVALKPIGHPIAAIPLDTKGKHHHGHGLGHAGGSYGVPPPPPPFGHAHGGHGGGGFGFGGASGGFISKPGHGGPPIFPQHDPDAEFIPRPGPGAPFKPNYGGYPQRPLPPPAHLPITKPLNTHIHHHIHHHEQNPNLNGPYLDGYYGAGAKSSVSVASPSGKALGTYPQAQTQTPSYAKNCVCVPADQCYNGIDQAGTQPAQIVHGLSTGIPNNGFVGYGIDPRNLKNGHGIESNATDVESTAASESVSDIPDSPASPTSRTRRETGGFEGGVLKSEVDGESQAETQPRQLFNYNQNAPRNCQPGFVCCEMGPQHPLQSVMTSNLVGYNEGRQQQLFGQCGKRQTEGINGRVISGGNHGNPAGFNADGDTNFGDYPWHVAILKNSEFVCSGSLIDSYHILTAAHCIKRLVPSQLKVRLGEWDVNHETEFYPFVEIQVESVLQHPNYYAGNLVNDVAILRLASSIEFPRHPHISPVCLPPPNIDFAGRRCFVSGWGKDAFGAQGKFQNVLKEVDLPVLTHFDCEQKLKRTRLGRDFTLDNGFMCAGGEANKDACKGDGGGGLVCDVQGTWYLAGIVSWGVGCGEVDVPGVYAKISEYTPWIQKNTGILH